MRYWGLNKEIEGEGEVSCRDRADIVILIGILEEIMGEEIGQSIFPNFSILDVFPESKLGNIS